MEARSWRPGRTAPRAEWHANTGLPGSLFSVTESPGSGYRVVEDDRLLLAEHLPKHRAFQMAEDLVVAHCRRNGVPLGAIRRSGGAEDRRALLETRGRDDHMQVAS